MVRDPRLEDRLRADLGFPEGLSEQPMFGGLCFLLHGNMLCAAREGRAMYRLGRAAEAEALAMPGVTPMIHGGHPQAGYVWAHPETLENDEHRRRLAALALEHAAHLPKKG